MVTSVSVEDYRKILDDNKSTDEQIKKRLEYLDAFCNNIIRMEIENLYLKKQINRPAVKRAILREIIIET